MSPLDYLFWDLVNTKVYQCRAGEPFSPEEQVKTEIKAVWKNCATDLKLLQKAIKQFVPRLRAAEEKGTWYIFIQVHLLITLKIKGNTNCICSLQKGNGL